MRSGLTSYKINWKTIEKIGIILISKRTLSRASRNVALESRFLIENLDSRRSHHWWTLSIERLSRLFWNAIWRGLWTSLWSSQCAKVLKWKCELSNVLCGVTKSDSAIESHHVIHMPSEPQDVNISSCDRLHPGCRVRAANLQQK